MIRIAKILQPNLNIYLEVCSHHDHVKNYSSKGDRSRCIQFALSLEQIDLHHRLVKELNINFPLTS